MTTKTFINQHWVGLVAVIAIFTFFLITKPFGCTPSPKPTIDTTTHTVYVPQPPVYIPQYIPVPTNSEKPIYIPTQYQPSTDQASLLKQYQDLVNKFLTVNTYKETIPLKDSTGTDVGHVDLNQKVSENTIQSNDFSYQLKFPHTTTTITIHDPYIPKFQILIGGGVTGNTKSFINGGYLGVGFRNKREQIYLLNAGIQNFNGLVPQFGISTFIPIKLKK